MRIYRAGLVPIVVNYDDIDQSKMLFMIPSNTKYGGADPQMAKGQIEENEDAYTAAIREAEEELGLRKDNIIQIHDLGNWLGRTQVYVAEVASDDMTQYDEPHFETGSVVWMTVDQFRTDGRDIHVELVEHINEFIHTIYDL